MAEYVHYWIILIKLLLLLIKSSSVHDECHESSCASTPTGYHNPLIKFPFQLFNGTHDQCPHPGFCLYCTQKNDTMLVLHTTSGPIEFIVEQIYYESQKIRVSDPESCLPKKFLKLHNSTFLPYTFDSVSSATISFLNCSSFGHQYLRDRDQISSDDSQDMKYSCPIHASNSYNSVLILDLVSCTKMFDLNVSINSIEIDLLSNNRLMLSWLKPNCFECERKGKKCRWRNDTRKVDTECFKCKGKRKTIHVPRYFILSSTGSILSGLVIIAIFKIYLHFEKKEEDQVRVDKFLEDYRAQKPTRFSYADLKRITSGFNEKLGEGAHGTIFKGKLSNEILVAVKMLNNSVEGEAKDFINEVKIMGKIHHINVVRFLGFCAEGIHRALVYNLFPNGSLQRFIFPPDNKDHFIGWDKLQQIALGIANGIQYLHEDCNHPILHFDINPNNVLLDDNFTPKISDFGLAKLCSKNLSVVSMTAARGTLGYMAPEVFSRNFGNVSLKSDIYSYGMLLLEMVGRRKNIETSSPETFQVLYPEWIHNLLEGDIHIHIDCEGDVKIAKKLAIVGLWCIQWQPMNRPSIKAVIQMLVTEDENLLTVPPNPFHSTNSITTRERTFIAQPFQMEGIQE